jgi:hypothetical protein
MIQMKHLKSPMHNADGGGSHGFHPHALGRERHAIGRDA